MKKIIATCFLILLVVVFASPARCEDSELARLFADKHIVGTIVLSELNGAKTYIYNERRANESFVPASTFKILNTLIALEEGVISERDVIKWDGKDKGLAAWNRDQTLETAFKSSCVWFYQELARRIGTAGYEAYLSKIKYGTGSPSPELTTFWLEGDLKISALEQVSFLKKLYKEELPFRQTSYKLLKRIMTVEQTPAYIIRAKTGWAERTAPQTGWYVGYVESGGKVWFFATNIDIAKPEDARYRKQVTMEALKLKGIIAGKGGMARVENDQAGHQAPLDSMSPEWKKETIDTTAGAKYLSAIERQVIIEINMVRTDPAEYARRYLVPLRAYYHDTLLRFPGEYAISTSEGVGALDECIRDLQAVKPSSPLSPRKGLTLAAREHARDQARTGAIGHSGSDRSTPEVRINRYGKWDISVGENINYGNDDARRIVTSLLIDDGVPSRGHRSNLLNATFRFVGVAVGPHRRYGHMCVMDFAGSYLKSEQKVRVTGKPAD